MHIDKDQMQQLLKQNDSQLWETVQKVAAESGVDLSSKKASPLEMSRLRTMLSAATDEDIKRAMEQLSKYGANKKK